MPMEKRPEFDFLTELAGSVNIGKSNWLEAYTNGIFSFLEPLHLPEVTSTAFYADLQDMVNGADAGEYKLLTNAMKDIASGTNKSQNQRNFTQFGIVFVSASNNITEINDAYRHNFGDQKLFKNRLKASFIATVAINQGADLCRNNSTVCVHKIAPNQKYNFNDLSAATKDRLAKIIRGFQCSTSSSSAPPSHAPDFFL
ncbi:hypothetical protein QR680_017912 [Steinernema hermaphroditum]|uniref:Uncharacterized protein n=1 Tax=Steinernema hermaphroditum TaxID=289476 RepID=A0AA39LPW2_9BILA|nr:hypothetical protein QR680_017912 [Steinernema hermaphroditum]